MPSVQSTAERVCVKWVIYQGRHAAVCTDLSVCAAKEGGSTRPLLQDSVLTFIKGCMHTGGIPEEDWQGIVIQEKDLLDI